MVTIYFRREDVMLTRMKLLYINEKLKRYGDGANITGVSANGTDKTVVLTKRAIEHILEVNSQQTNVDTRARNTKITSADMTIHLDATGNMIIDL